jgi:hypothetical protein
MLVPAVAWASSGPAAGAAQEFAKVRAGRGAGVLGGLGLLCCLAVVAVIVLLLMMIARRRK